MSAPTSLIKQFVTENRSADGIDGSGGIRAIETESDDPTLAEIKTAAREGASEALGEHGGSESAKTAESGADVGTTGQSAADASTDDQSSSGRSLKRVLLVGIVAVYLLRRRRSGQSDESQPE